MLRENESYFPIRHFHNKRHIRHFHHRSKNCAASGLQKLRPFAAQKLRPFAAQTYKILGKNQITHGQSIFSRPIHAINPGLQMQLS
jgi:hypothetical protein